MSRIFLTLLIVIAGSLHALGQINTEQVVRIGRNNLYFEDYVLSIQYFNQAINAKPHLAQPYFYRAVAKFNLDDYLGAEADATAALERNPYIVDAYEVRGLARQFTGNNRGAVADYDAALAMLPENRGLLYNKALAQQEMNDLAGADSTYTRLLRFFPGFEGGYIGRARLRLAQKDTVAARADIDRALQINKNAVNAYVMRADIAISSAQDYREALEDMNQAIRLQPKFTGFYINRAFLRYMTDDFNGAFADYDYALQLDPQNETALFNRGMLRAEVQDRNRAIDDFSTVLSLNPYDYKALYNRSILLADIGDFDAALDDLGRVIDAFPDFAAPYFVRFDVLRRKGDMRAAQRDYDKSMALAKTRVQTERADRFFGRPDSDSPASSSATSDNSDSSDSSDNSDSSETQEQIKARFSSLTTIADNTSPEQIYNNKEIRGRVQDRNVNIEMEPIFLITYYTSPTELKLSGDYMREVDDINSTRILRFLLQVSNREPQMTDESVAQTHFSSIGYYNSYLATHTPRAIDYLGRAMDFMTLRNYESAIEDLSKAIALTPDFALAYLLRANARYLSRNIRSDEPSETAASRTGVPKLVAGAPRIAGTNAIRLAIADLDSVIALSPLSPIPHFNKGVMLAQEGDNAAALQAFTRAIELRPDFGEAYFNRGYVYLSLGNRDAAFADLSRAGQLGIVPSYNLLKRMSR